MLKKPTTWIYYLFAHVYELKSYVFHVYEKWNLQTSVPHICNLLLITLNGTLLHNPGVPPNTTWGTVGLLGRGIGSSKACWHNVHSWSRNRASAPVFERANTAGDLDGTATAAGCKKHQWRLKWDGKWSACLIRHHVLKVYWGVEGYLHEFFTSALGVGNWTTSWLSRFISWENFCDSHWTKSRVGVQVMPKRRISGSVVTRTLFV